MSKAVLANLICSGLEKQIQLNHHISTEVLGLVKAYIPVRSAFASLRLCVSFVTKMDIPQLYKEYNLR